VFTTFVVAALPTLAPKVAAHLGLAPHAIGYQVSIVYIMAALVSVYSGVAVRRLGACTASMLSLASGVLALLSIASGSIAGIIIGSVVLGLGYGLPGPAASHLFMRFAPLGRRNLIFSIKQAGMPLGVAMASFLLPVLSEWIGWRASLAASTLLLVAVIVGLSGKRARWDDDRQASVAAGGSALAGISLVLANPVLRGIGGVGLCYGGYQMCVIAFSVTMLVQEFGWTLVDAGLLAGGMQIAGVCGRIGWSLVADATRSGLPILGLLGVLSAGFGLAVAWLGSDMHGVLLVAVLMSLSASMLGWNGILLAETARVSGRESVGLATGGILALCFLSVVIQPALFALAYKGVGNFTRTLGLFAIMPLIGAACAMQAWRHDRLKRGRAIPVQSGPAR
jgi:MFS family permease